MSILIEKPGILTTVQDLGRIGYRSFGINPGAVMDRTADRLMNILLGNDDNEAVLEIHFPAAQIKFETNALIAIGGADFSAELDGKPVENWRVTFAKKRSILKFTGKVSGNRAYLAVRGGIKVEKWLGSASTNLAAKIGGIDGRKLESGDRIPVKQRFKRNSDLLSGCVGRSLLPLYSRFPTVRIVAGSEFDSLSKKGRALLTDQNYTIRNNSDRMGFRLSGEPISLAKPIELLSSAVSFGTIQLLPDGQMIVLMADHQTTGGYPRVANVISCDLPLLAQLGAGDKVAFHLIEHAEAERLALKFERELSFFRVGCRFQANL